MSVIPESLAGDEIVCLDEFVGSPVGQPFSWETCRKFRVGERVRFASWYEDKHAPDNPVCWMVVFDAADGKRYAATQTFFVTTEGWEKLRKYFARQQRRAAGAPKKGKATPRRGGGRKKPAAANAKKRRSA